MGGSDACGNFEPAQSSGERMIRLDSPISGNIWFACADPSRDGDGIFVEHLTITADTA